METKKCLLCKVKPQMRFEMGDQFEGYILECPSCHIFSVRAECYDSNNDSRSQQANVHCVVKWNELDFKEEVLRLLTEQQRRLDETTKDLFTVGKVITGFLGNCDDPDKFDVDIFIANMLKKGEKDESKHV